MKTNCSRCNGDDPSCYVCQDRRIDDGIAQLEYAFEMHEKCCEHLNLDPDNTSEGDMLLEAICRLEKDRDEWREEADLREKSLDLKLSKELLRSALRDQDFDEIRSIITKGGTASDVLKFLDTLMP
jgi:hypothetical protein